MIRVMILLTVLSVTTQMQTGKKKVKDSDKSEMVNPVKKVVIDRSMTSVPPIDNLDIKKVDISKNLLTITFPFLGTEEDDFDLFFNGMDMKSLPPQAIVRLKQVKKSGKIDAQTKTMGFDIEPMKSDGTELHIKLDGYKEKIVYKYDEK